MKISKIYLLPCLLALCACDGGPAPTGVSAETPVVMPTPSTAVPVPPATIASTMGRGILRADPETLSKCESATVSISWDASKLYPALTAVEIHVTATGEATGKLFAAGGATGTATTGPWAKPGLVFVARDTIGNELDRITLGGPVCM